VKAQPTAAVGFRHESGTTVRKASNIASDPAEWPLGKASFHG